MKRITLTLTLTLLSLWSLAQTISSLPAASTLGGTEVVPGVQGGTTKKISINQVRTYVWDTPTLTNLTTVSTIKITGGSPGAGKVLTSDADGDATWENATGGHTIEDEGTPVTQRTNMNFTGSGVAVTDAGGKTVVTITGSAVTPAALTKTDDTNVTLTLGGTPATSLLQATSLTLGWTGQLAVSRGGTGISSFGTGVATALGINVGSAGAFVTFNGALGTPSSGTATNITGLPISTGVSGLGTGIATALGVNTGSAGAPVLFNGAGGTPSSLTLTNATGATETYDATGWNGDSSPPTKDDVRDKIESLGTQYLEVMATDQVTPIAAVAGQRTFIMANARTLTAVHAFLVTPQASGSIFTVDVNEGGTTILSTKLTIDNTEDNSTTAATPAVISDSSLAQYAEISIDVDQIGNGSAIGLILIFYWQWILFIQWTHVISVIKTIRKFLGK